MPIIYQTKGKAREYCELAANLYMGCNHGCTYCYAPAVLHKARNTFHRNSRPRKDIIINLEKEAPKYRGKEVLLSFACDPYPKISDRLNITRNAINILSAQSVNLNILTKGGTRAEKDFDLLAENSGKFGTTLTFLSVKHSLFYEPGAAFPNDRIDAIKRAKDKGIVTWVSLEPVIDPAQTIELVEATRDFVDEYKVGRWNYAPIAEYIDWHKFLIDITKLFQKHNLKYYIKNDLAKFLPSPRMGED